MFAVPYKMTIDKTDDFIEMNGRMFDRTVNAVKICVQMSMISDLKFGTGILKQENLARTKKNIELVLSKEFSQCARGRRVATYVLNWVVEKCEDEEYEDLVVEEDEIEVEEELE